MERFSILLGKHIKDEAVQKAFKSYIGTGLVCDDDEVVEQDFKDELLVFVTEHPEFEKSVSLD